MDAGASTADRARRPLGMRGAGIVVLVNGGEDSALGERARWVARAAGPGASIDYRASGRAQALGRFVRRVRAARPRTVYLVDTAIATVVAGAWARRLGARVVLDTGDATAALTRTSGRLGLLGRAGAPLLERLAYALAAVVVVRSEELGRHVQSLARRPVVVVPDGFDPDLVDTAGGAEHRRRWGSRRGADRGRRARLRALERAPALVLRTRRHRGGGGGPAAGRARRRAGPRRRGAPPARPGRPAGRCRPRRVRRPRRRARGVAAARGRRRGIVDADRRRGGAGADHRQARAVHGGGPVRPRQSRRRRRRAPARADARRLSWGLG